MKQRIAMMLGFKGFRHAAITIAGIELMHRIRKGQFGLGRLGVQGRTAPAVWKRAPSLKSRQYNAGRFPAPAICTRALETILIPDATNTELKDLLTTGLKIFQGHEQHAEHVAQSLK